MRIGGVFKANQLIGKYLVGDGFFLAHFPNSCRSPCCSKTDGGPGSSRASRTRWPRTRT